jgi:hypothetical protein
MNEIAYRFLGEDRPFGHSLHDEGVIFLKRLRVSLSISCDLDVNAHGEGAIGDRQT